MDALQPILIGVAYVILGIIALVLAKVAKELLTPYRLDEELTARDNPALGLTLSGYFAGTIIIFLGAVIGPEPETELTVGQILNMMTVDFTYALGGILALNLGRWTVDRLVLTEFDTTKEIIEDRNAGTGAVECGVMIATGLVVAGAIHGEGGGLLSALIFFVLGQAVLVLFTRLYQAMTLYDIHAEIERDNVAAGVALGTSMVAMGIIILKGIAGDLESWSDKLSWFGADVIVGAALLMGVRKVTDALFLPDATIGKEIAEDRNLNAAWIEGTIATGIASIIFFVV